MIWKTVFGRVDLKNATLKIKDGTGTPNEITVNIGEGTLSWTEHQAREYLLNRGALDDVRNGDDTPVDVQFDFIWDYVKGTSGSPSPYEAIKNIGNAASWTSTDSDACNPYAVDLEFTVDAGSACGDIEVILFADFRHEEISADPKDASLRCSGKCNITAPSITRS